MIGERLRDIRKRNKINQQDLGEILGVQKTTISLYESNKSSPNDNTKKKIAMHFNISLDYLLGVIDEPVPYYVDAEFLRLPRNVTEEERFMLSEVLRYIEFRRSKELGST